MGTCCVAPGAQLGAVMTYMQGMRCGRGRRGGSEVQERGDMFPGGLDGEELTSNVGDLCLIPRVGKMSWRRKWPPTPIFLPGEFHGHRRLMDYIQSMGSQRVGHD